MKVSEIRQRARRRKEDYEMPIYLPFVPAILGILTAILGIIAAVLGSMIPRLFGPSTPGWSDLPGIKPRLGILAVSVVAILVIIAIIAGLLGIYVLYKWIDRRNNHFQRVLLLYEDVLDFLEEKGEKVKVKKARRTLREMEIESKEKSAVLWIVLTIVFGPVILYVLHFLSKDFLKHEKQENLLFEGIEDAVESAGGDFKRTEYDAIENRNTILYIVLTIVTLGLFGLYWIYTLTKDPNEHFRQSKMTEEDLLSSLETIE